MNEEAQAQLLTVDQKNQSKVHPQACSCAGCSGAATGAAPPSFVYAIGRVEARFPSLGVEKEFAQAAARDDIAGKTDRQAMHAVLTRPENRYLVRQLCWVFTVENLEVYLLRPRDPGDVSQLLEALRPAPRPTDVDVLIGRRGPLARPDMCNGLILPIVAFDQLYSFDIDGLVGAIPRPDTVPADAFTAAAEEVFQRIMQLADNAGSADEHRALNYLAVRYSAIYAMAAERFARNMALSGVDVRPSRLGATRNIVDVVFEFTNRATDVREKQFVRVDVSEEFPFLVTKLTPYFDR